MSENIHKTKSSKKLSLGSHEFQKKVPHQSGFQKHLLKKSQNINFCTKKNHVPLGNCKSASSSSPMSSVSMGSSDFFSVLTSALFEFSFSFSLAASLAAFSSFNLASFSSSSFLSVSSFFLK